MLTVWSKIAAKFSLVLIVAAMLVLIPQNVDLSFGYSWENIPASGPWRCMNDQPNQVVLYRPGDPLLPVANSAGEVRLNWLKVARADKYTIGYGVQPGVYIYGVNNTGDTDSYTISNLNPGQTYYFVVRGVNGCMPGPWSPEWAARSAGGGVQLTSVTQPTTITGDINQLNTITTPRQPQPSPRLTVSPQPIGQDVPQGEPTPQGGFWQRLSNWFVGLFR